MDPKFIANVHEAALPGELSAIRQLPKSKRTRYQMACTVCGYQKQHGSCDGYQRRTLMTYSGIPWWQRPERASIRITRSGVSYDRDRSGLPRYA